MRYHLIINPASAWGKTRQHIPEIREAYRLLKAEVVISVTEQKGQATALSRSVLNQIEPK